MENIRNEVIIKNEDNIQLMIPIFLGILEIEYGKFTYKQLSEKINTAFGTNITVQDLSRYFQPTIEQDHEDLMLQLKHLNF